MSIFAWITDLFYDKRFYKQSEIPSDLPVEFWAIYLDLDIRSAVRICTSSSLWSEIDQTFDNLRIYKECSPSNPMVVCLVNTIGKPKRIIALSKREFMDNFGFVKEVDELGLYHWFSQMYEENRELITRLKSLRDTLDNMRR